MIGWVRRIYDPSHACFNNKGESEGASADLFKEGYVELFGEINPQPIETLQYSITPQKPSSEKETSNIRSIDEAVSLVYEYFWSVGMASSDPNWYNKLDDPDPIVIQLILHTQGSKYVTQDIAANLKQVPPFQKTTENKIQDWFTHVQPIVDTAGKMLSLGGAKVPGEILSAISQMKLNTVPVDQFPWWVKTFSFQNDPGIEWHIPKNLIQHSGNRVVGSFGIRFIKCDSPDIKKPLEDEFSIEIRAFVRSGKKELYLSPTNKKTGLKITPKPKQ